MKWAGRLIAIAVLLIAGRAVFGLLHQPPPASTCVYPAQLDFVNGYGWYCRQP